MNKETQIILFNKFVDKNYEIFKRKMQKMCHLKHFTYSDDVLQDTLLKVLAKIQKTGINAENEKGIENYIFRAFVLNTYQMHKQLQNSKLDYNVNLKFTPDDGSTYNEKIDIMLDYLKELVTMEFGTEKCKLWYLKYYTNNNYTFKQLKEITGIEKPKKIIDDINKYLKTNVNKDILKRI